MRKVKSHKYLKLIYDSTFIDLIPSIVFINGWYDPSQGRCYSIAFGFLFFQIQVGKVNPEQ